MLANVFRKSAARALFVQPKRFGGSVAGPVNYSHIHLHNIDDLFDANKSTLHEERGREMGPAESAIALQTAFDSLPSEIDKCYNAITCPEERMRFDKTIRPLLTQSTQEELDRAPERPAGPQNPVKAGGFRLIHLVAIVCFGSAGVMFYESISRSVKYFKNLESGAHH